MPALLFEHDGRVLTDEFRSRNAALQSRDQIEDYARRKGWTVAEAERSLAGSSRCPSDRIFLDPTICHGT